MWRVEYVLVCGDELLPSFSTQLVVYHANMYGDRDVLVLMLIVEFVLVRAE